MSERLGLLERLAAGPVIGDGSMILTLEKRGYVKGGPFTPEAVMEYPEAVRQLSTEYLRAGSDVIQSCTFFGGDDQMSWRPGSKMYKASELNKVACEIAREVANKGDALVCGGISPTQSYADKLGKEAVKAEFRKQVDCFVENKVDFLLGEFLAFVEEAVWAVETMKESGLPVAVTMRMGPTGDMTDLSPGEVAVKLASAGADMLGLNCQYDPKTCIEVIKVMKAALDAEGLKPYLMLQPVGFHCPDAVNLKMGYHELPEFPFALEPRLLTRWDCRRYAREAYEAGVRYFGGCCGFEPYHIREVAEELAEERGKRPLGQDKNGIYGSGMTETMSPFLRVRTGAEYWMTMEPATGRFSSAAISKVKEPLRPILNGKNN